MDLQSIWFFIWTLLWALFFMTDGFDLGIGILYPFLGTSEEKKRLMINAIGPLWDGNEVWLITAGGVTFAAFPILYSAMFSTLYTAMMLILFGLILRGVSFEFRGQLDHAGWRKLWDNCIFIGSALPSLLFGVAFANIFTGRTMDGSIVSLLSPYTLLGGFLFFIMFMVHGAIWLCIRTDGHLQSQAASGAKQIWVALLFVAISFLATSCFTTNLYENYLNTPILFIVPIIALSSLFAIRFFLGQKAWFKAWIASATSIVGITFFGMIGLYPTMLPPTPTKNYALTAFNASSSPMTLKIMLVVVLIFIPLVIGYQIWAYRLFSGKVTAKDLTEEEAY